MVRYERGEVLYNRYPPSMRQSVDMLFERVRIAAAAKPLALLTLRGRRARNS